MASARAAQASPHGGIVAASKPTVPVLFIVPQNALLLDLAGPAEVLRLASALDASEAGQAPPRFELMYAGPVANATTSIGMPLLGLAPLPDRLPDGAIVVLVGAGSTGEPALCREIADAIDVTVLWLKRVWPEAGPASRLMCVCSGALIAARAGLLDGRRCTTHHSLCAELQQTAPRATVLENRLFVSDGDVSTSAGITAGIDMMLHTLSELAGPRIACAVARSMVVYMRRAGADPQLSPWIAGRNHLHPGLHRVQDAVAADPARSWSAEDMAGIACASTRHLARLFHEYAGGSPLDYVQRLRVALARDMIARTSLDMETVAGRSGFTSARHLRRTWTKYYATPPSEVRSTAPA